MGKKNGYDYYLEFQYKYTGDFYTALIRAVSQADGTNLEKIAQGFPSLVEAYKCWTRTGVEEFAKHVTPNCIATRLFEEEYGVKVGVANVEN